MHARGKRRDVKSALYLPPIRKGRITTPPLYTEEVIFVESAISFEARDSLVAKPSRVLDKVLATLSSRRKAGLSFSSDHMSQNGRERPASGRYSTPANRVSTTDTLNKMIPQHKL